MSRYALSILFSLYTCIGWGMVAPLLVKMKQSGMGLGPLHPFMWDTIGRVVIITATLLILALSPFGRGSGIGQAGRSHFCGLRQALPLSTRFSWRLEKSQFPTPLPFHILRL